MASQKRSEAAALSRHLCRRLANSSDIPPPVEALQCGSRGLKARVIFSWNWKWLEHPNCLPELHLFSQDYLDIIDIQLYISLKYTMWLPDTCIYHEMFTTVRFVNTSFTSHNFHSVVFVAKLYLQARKKSHGEGKFHIAILQADCKMVAGARLWRDFQPHNQELKPSPSPSKFASLESYPFLW